MLSSTSWTLTASVIHDIFICLLSCLLLLISADVYVEMDGGGVSIEANRSVIIKTIKTEFSIWMEMVRHMSQSYSFIYYLFYIP